VERAHAQETALTARVLQRVKGGLMVHVGVPAFLPGSQVDIRPVADLDSFLGQQFPVLVLKLAKARGNVVVSRRKLLEEEIAHLKSQTLSQLAEGAIVKGRVKNVTEYGAFVDLGGIDGLIHVTDVSWSRIKSPTDILTPGEEISAKVLKFDAEKERVSLSLKHLHPDPWENIAQRYHEGDRVRGRVVSITDYGAFAEIEPGVEGLVHVSAMTWSKRLKHPSKYVAAGQEIEAAVLNIRLEERRISLSLKHLAPDPWTTVIERYKLGSVVEGRVRNLTSYGAFIELEEGVDGLVHVSDLSWSSRVKHPQDVLKKGQQTRAAVLHVDIENRRLSLGLKQLQPDVWETFLSMHRVGDVLDGYVTRQAKFGVFVELAAGVEGLCHNSEMATNSHGGRKNPLQVGEKYGFRIIRLDEYDRRIGLSRRALEKDGDANYQQQQPTVTVPSGGPAE
jgi:small subunit ribosomal protein S1